MLYFVEKKDGILYDNRTRYNFFFLMYVFMFSL